MEKLKQPFILTKGCFIFTNARCCTTEANKRILERLYELPKFRNQLSIAGKRPIY
ncbi:MAG: hypothetical protein LBL74_04145 [Bacteroidales bacterium]|nr:hypothetical protein [Bacteroidales bacterium]